jgi:hypothetical protein
MAHTIQQFWHDHAGARWLTPFAIAIFAVVGVLVFMLARPYV